ncbi:glycosyltransferase [Paenibacillus sp. PK1-4R]|uniref:glycosyltransferase family 2 protein n=1 Tax=Paenibacillus sp. PK1-4R TaxID=3049075 RepID=UPI00259FED09|nr:glycosyltransferase [Paenibacillus sp. PK1-4R]WJM07854.1 glycosyltransferase [Paenibacillus sp. PK1-4R]
MDNLTATKLLESLHVGREGIIYLENCIKQEEMSLSNMGIFDEFLGLIRVVENLTNTSTIPNRVKEINANIIFYINELKLNMKSDKVESFLYNFKFHFTSLFRILEYEVAYLVENIVTKRDYPDFYPEIGIVDHEDIIMKGKNSKCKVSIVLLAYNNLSYTKDCVESILMNTGDVDYELILVDNGSTDGTKEYFDSIIGAKVIHLKYNIHLVKGFNIGLMAAEGKYCAAVCNDFIFTPNWIENLMICIESDQKIGFVSPGATFISNLQQIPVPFVSKEDFQERAKDYNVSDPAKWEERVVLLPNVLCCPTALLDRIGYYDTRYYRGEFLDDDISFRIRRAGYKLVYCGDTVAHHYGSLTTAVDHQSNSLQEGRETFQERYDLDAWLDARMNVAYLDVDENLLSGVNSILGIDVKCGATLLQLKNRIWSNYGNKPMVYVCSTERKYDLDVRSISEQVVVLENLIQLSSVENVNVDLAYIEKPLDLYSEDLDTIFSSVADKMNTNGKLIFMVNNVISIEVLYEMLNSSHSIHNRKHYIPDVICIQARMHGFELTSITNYASQQSADRDQIVNNLASFLAKGERKETEYLKSLLNHNYGLYQMNYVGI